MLARTEKMLVDVDGAPLDRIVGFETEYGFAGIHAINGQPTTISDNTIKAALHTDAISTFRSDGNRIYLDHSHPELSTAEELSFNGAAHRLLAGHVVVARLCAQILEMEDRPASENIREISLIANTCDAAGNSFGSHENYLTRRELLPIDYIYPLATHHASRIVWSGAGRVQPHSEGKGYDFDLSEKAQHIHEIANNNTTHLRPLVNLRDNPLADHEQWRRIHVSCGESVFSPFTNALRLASGSLVLRACEVGENFEDLLLEDPVDAMHQISKDPTLQVRVRLNNGQHYRGVDLQRAIAERSMAAAERNDYLTDQEREKGERWIDHCDNLAADPIACRNRVDWVVKQKLIEREVEVKKDTGKSVAEVATAKSFQYHTLMPGEEQGMKMVRKDRFDDSPSPEVLESGLPLPPTRAKIRGQAISAMSGLDSYRQYVSWTSVRVTPNTDEGTRTFTLLDPYATEHPRLMEYLADLAA